MDKRRGFIARRVLVASILVLPVAALIAVLSTGVMSRGMFGDAGRWVAWAVLATWTDGTGFMYPTTTTNNVVIGDSTQSGADIRLNDGGVMIVNEQGNDSDCRIEGDTDANLIYTDAGSNYVGIGTSTPGAKLTVVQSGTLPLIPATTSMVIQNSANAGDDCNLVILSDNTGGAGITFGYTDTPANTEVSSLATDMNTGELHIKSEVTRIDSGQRVKRTAVNSNYTVLATDYYIGVTVTSTITLTLPNPSTAGEGKMYVIKRENTAGNNLNVTTTSGTATFDALGTTATSTTDYATITVVSDGSNWCLTSQIGTWT